MKGKRRDEVRHVQARLNPGIEDEYEALDVFYQWLDSGVEQREIVVRALLALGNKEQPPQPQSMTSEAIQQALAGMGDFFADLMGSVLDQRLEEFAQMSPQERRHSIRQEAQSSFKRSILGSVDVANYGDDNGGDQ